MVAALLHDIGKGGLTEHSVAGEPLARAIADPDGLRRARRSTWSARLVRRHLLLAETATTRDPDDPATAADRRRADRRPPRRSTCCWRSPRPTPGPPRRRRGRRGGPGWSASLAAPDGRAARRRRRPSTATAPDEVAGPARAYAARGGVAIQVEAADGGAAGHRAGSGDRVGLLADAAALFALQRASVRSARAWTAGRRRRLGVGRGRGATSTRRCCASGSRRSSTGRLDPAARLGRPTPAGSSPTVAVRPEASARGHRARGARRRPARRRPPGLRGPGRPRPDGPLRARRHPRPAGGRRVLRAGARRRRALRRPAPPRPRTPSRRGAARTLVTLDA